MRDPKAYRNSLIFSVCYVGFATIALFSMFPDSILHGDWALMSMILTMPVSVISFGVIFGGGDQPYASLLVFLIQSVMFLLTWYISYKIFRKKDPHN